MAFLFKEWSASIPMASTVIDHFDYDAASAILRVTFLSGAVYYYKAVPESIFERMSTAASKGKFLNKYIKGKFLFEKITPTG